MHQPTGIQEGGGAGATQPAAALEQLDDPPGAKVEPSADAVQLQEQLLQVQLQQEEDRKRQANLEQQIESSVQAERQAKQRLRDKREQEMQDQRAAEAALRETKRADLAEADKRARMGPAETEESPVPLSEGGNGTTAIEVDDSQISR